MLKVKNPKNLCSSREVSEEGIFMLLRKTTQAFNLTSILNVKKNTVIINSSVNVY